MPPQLRPKSANRNDLRGLSYDDLQPGKPPINITVAPTPSSALLGVHPSLRPSTSPEPGYSQPAARSKLYDDIRRDSGLATSSTARESRTTIGTDTESAVSIRNSQSLPRVNAAVGSRSPSVRRFRRKVDPKMQDIQDEPPRLPETSFQGLSTAIPTISFEDLTSPDKIQFSKRGSMLISGRRASETVGKPNGQSRASKQSTTPNSARISSRVLSVDEEALSQKVRSMYESGTDQESMTVPEKFSAAGIDGIEEEAVEEEPVADGQLQAPGQYLTAGNAFHRAGSTSTSRRESFIREENELAGGIEDWKGINGEDLDRYGFIVPRPRPLNNGSTVSLPAPSEPRIHRVSTALQLASERPRRQRSKIGRAPSTTRSTTTATSGHQKRSSINQRPLSSQSSYRSTSSAHISRFRSAGNRLPHNRQRRIMDEAGDMLTLPPGLADIAEHEEGGKAADLVKRKEWEREEKWRKMAKVTKPTGGAAGGQTFEFDTKNAKLIQRTWKGIPDKWRATAWYSFLNTSAKKTPGSPTDEELIACFKELVDQSSPDDVQIDIDVPRTISSHIMFRRRYRGGQRLLFRVLHCLSLYFPDTGYVQGMAALAATFLCYFDEEMAFVMLARMWQLRGLDRLYQSGFEGLMQALEEFEKKWLDGRPVAKKMACSKFLLMIHLTRILTLLPSG